MIRNQQQTSTKPLDEGDVRASKRLWASVVRTAADDLHRHHLKDDRGGRPDGLKAQAEAWIRSDSEEIASFLWCCDILDLNAAAVRESVRNGTSTKSHGTYANLLKQFNKTREVEKPDEDPDEEV